MTENKPKPVGVSVQKRAKYEGKNLQKPCNYAGFGLCNNLVQTNLKNEGKTNMKGEEKMDENKKKFALWVHPSTIEKVERLYQLDNCRSRSEFIEKAILFYSGYVSAEDGRDYFPEVIVSTLQGSLDTFENRMASLMFKYAVELDMLMHVTAANFRVDEDTLSRLRGKCVKEVKSLYGKISFEDAVRYQRGKN